MYSFSAWMVNAFVQKELFPHLQTYRVLNAIRHAKIALDLLNLIVPAAIQLLIQLLLSSTRHPTSVNPHAQITFTRIGRILPVLNVQSDAFIAQALKYAKYAMTKQTTENFRSRQKDFNLVPVLKVTTKIPLIPKTMCASNATFQIVWIATVLKLAHFATN